MPTWVCLLRAINLGSHNKVAMPRLRELLAEAGFTDVRTYVQSGNVVVSSPLRTAPQVADAIHAVVLDGFGVDTPVVVRTPRQLAEVVTWNPFPAQAGERPQHVYVLFLSGGPEPAKAATLLEADWSPDAVALRGSELAIAYGEALSRSKLQHSLVLRRLGVDGTARNWRTVTALQDLC